MGIDSEHKWTIADIRHFLNTRVGYQIPRSTLARWKAFLEVRPVRVTSRVWLYSDSDRDWLITLALWVKSGRTLTEFDYRFNQENRNGKSI